MRHTVARMKVGLRNVLSYFARVHLISYCHFMSKLYLSCTCAGRFDKNKSRNTMLVLIDLWTFEWLIITQESWWFWPFVVESGSGECFFSLPEGLCNQSYSVTASKSSITIYLIVDSLRLFMYLLVRNWNDKNLFNNFHICLCILVFLLLSLAHLFKDSLSNTLMFFFFIALYLFWFQQIVLPL